MSLSIEEIERLAVEHEAFGFGLADDKAPSTHGFDPDGLVAFARAVERAARAAAFREAADMVWRIHEQPVEDVVDALRARAEGGA